MESNEVNASFFPPPPSRYLLFTNPNIRLATQLDSALPSTAPFDPSLQKQLLLNPPEGTTAPIDDDHLAQVENIDLRTLVQPPNLEWIREKGGWTAFGDWEPWPGKATRASLEGMPRLYDAGMERKDALQALLNTLIHSYLQLLDVLGHQGPTSMAVINEAHANQTPVTSNTDQIVSHIELAAFNMHGLCNELRPRQARETLKLMMREQAREKREKAQVVLQTCEELRTQLASLRASDELIDQTDHSEPLALDHKDGADTAPNVGPDWDKLLAVADEIMQADQA